MEKINRTLTIAECIELWDKEEMLNAKIAQLENECAELRGNAYVLHQEKQQLLISISNLCYDMSQILKITGIMADTKRTLDGALSKYALEKK